MAKIKRVLVANRGEIAVRIIRACRDLGIETVAVYSDVDRESLHVRYATRAYRLGPAPATESYLRIDKILEVAKESGADAIHPGYGFLAENADFARAAIDAGIIFIGPEPDVMEAVGDKNRARQIAVAAGAPTVPGSPEPVDDPKLAAEIAEQLGYPVMLKAVAGGGGKGMRMVTDPADIESSLRSASSEAASAFGDGRVYIEKAILNPRHVEIQILCDEHGNRIHLGERECSLQRRHQKVVEESPSPVHGEEMRQKMGAAALAIATEANYSNAGTVEFLVDANDDFYFIEVNARLQVEHPVTEMVTGIDLVAAQIAVAEGEPLPWSQDDIQLRGAAIECRIYAEDPANGFAPSPGLVEGLRVPGGPGIRDDSALYEGCEIPIYYDPMISKLVAWGPDRDTALARMRRALLEYKVVGISTTISLFQRILEDPNFIAGTFDTGYLDELLKDGILGPSRDRTEETAEVAAITGALHTFLREEARAYQIRNGGTSAWKIAGRNASLRNFSK